MDTIKTGSNIDSWCTKCKLVLAHTIEAISNGTIKRVVCNTCKGKHQYKAKAPNSGTDTVAKPKVSSAKEAKIKLSELAKSNSYLKLIKSKDLAQGLNYSIKSRFNKGDLLIHQSFGIGVVIEDKETQKIEVLFETGAKILAHNR